MKKLFIASLLTLVGLSSFAQGILTTNLSASGTHLLTTNRIKVYQIEVATTNAQTFRFYDNDNLTHTGASLANSGFWGTNVVTGANYTRVSYPTNFATSFVGQTGFTNWYTNSGIYSLWVTNTQATNALAATATVATGGAETRLVGVDALFTRGVIIGGTGTGSITLYYRFED
jgi:hypothetical protein